MSTPKKSLLEDTSMRYRIQNNNVDFVQLETEDSHGILRGMTIDKDYFLRNYKLGFPFPKSANSICVDGSLIQETGIENENGTLYPDHSTMRITPWRGNTASVYCDFKLEYNNPECASVETSTRALCKTQVDKLEELGYKLCSAFEYEFYIINQNRSPMHNDANFGLTSLNLRSRDYIHNIMEKMKQVYMQPETYNVKFGPAQHEITQSPKFGIDGSDLALSFKSIVKESFFDHRNEYSALFASAPIQGHGSSGYLNHSLWSLDEKVNHFEDVEQQYKLSSIAQNWLAGLQEHAKGLMCLACPTYNCYKRIKSDANAPKNNSWGFDDKTVGFGVKNLGPKTYISNRIPGASVNPYLITAGCIIAGMDGIKRNLQLKTPPYKGEPIDSEELPDNIIALPTSLSDALNCLLDDELLVEGLGTKFITAYTAIIKNEIKEGGSQSMNGRSGLWSQKYNM